MRDSPPPGAVQEQIQSTGTYVLISNTQGSRSLAGHHLKPSHVCTSHSVL